MAFLKRSLLLGAGLFVMLMIISACGGTTTITSPDDAYSTPATTAPTTGAAVVKTAQVTIDGKATTVLTDAKGLTLYYYTPDTAAKTACTGGCASAWPPLLFTGKGNPTATTKLSGTLETYANANGNQVTYNGHPLYTFSGDTAPGQATGQDKNDVWYVATPDLKKQ